MRPALDRLPEFFFELCRRGVSFPAMRWLKSLVIFVLAAVSVQSLDAAGARIVKVLPHYLDREGRHALSPSLFERDAYQSRLRRHPEERAALRLDVQWKAPAQPSDLKIRMELRGLQGKNLTQKTLEAPAKKNGWFGHWTSLTLAGDDFNNLGGLTAWRATLWSGDQQLAEQKSFLW